MYRDMETRCARRICHANYSDTCFVPTDAPAAVLPDGKLVGLRGKRPDSALLWYILSAASVTAALLVTPDTQSPPFPPRVGQVDRRRQAAAGLLRQCR